MSRTERRSIVEDQIPAPPTGRHLTALDAVEDRVRGLDAGADDYLPKPFAFQELLARLRALGRRRVQIREPDRLRAADLVLDLRRRRAERNGKTIELSPKEFALLEFLMSAVLLSGCDR